MAARASTMSAARLDAQLGSTEVVVVQRAPAARSRWWWISRQDRGKIATLLLFKLFFLVLVNVMLSIFILYNTHNYHMLQKGRLAKHASSEPAIAKAYRQRKLNAGVVDHLDYVLKRNLLVNANDTLFIDEIEAINHGQPLVIEAGDGEADSTKLVLKSFNENIENCLTLSNKDMDFKTNNLKFITEQKVGNRVRSSTVQITPDKMSIDADIAQLRQSSSGLRVATQLNTSRIQADVFHNMRIESRTGRMNVKAKGETKFESAHGGIDIEAFEDVHLSGVTVFDARTIIVSHMPRDTNTHHHQEQQQPHRVRHHHKSGGGRASPTAAEDGHEDELLAYQLCVCANGKLFAVKPGAACAANDRVCSI